MAKGLRASTKKANRAKLRSKVFAPVEDARTQRLSAKLLELASKQRPKTDEDVKMGEEAENGMDIDDLSSPVTDRRSSRFRIQKRRRGKASSSVAFPVYTRGRQVAVRKRLRK
ncbi:hypothetical protein MMC13_001485 [Lambiella insularis]|nr:hypothetical protein [Lambiella insularis]